MENLKKTIIFSLVLVFHLACQSSLKDTQSQQATKESSFNEDVSFLKEFIDVIVLEEPAGKGKIAISPALQGRVMTSTSNGEMGTSYGWINKELFVSRDTLDHINAFGGEERLWLGPEGGQFSIFFEKGKDFTLDNWFTPRLLDLEAFDLISRTGNEASFSRTAELKNYSGTNFRIRIDRLIRVLTPNEAFAELGVNSAFDINSVAYQSTNSLTNIGSADWNKRSGLLSIWMLGMFKPSPEMTIVLPFNKGDEQAIGPVVNDDYFGKVPQDRLKVGDGIIYFKGDGKYRSKIGLTPLRAKNLIGSYDGASNTLTILKFNKPDNTVDYVNSKWEMQDQPFRGDVINSYNDGPAEPGAKPMGPFYELESSSPALELKKGESLVHRQTTFHFQGNEKSLDRLALEVFGVSVIEINEVFK